MRRVIAFMVTTLDGYVAGPNGEIDWHVVDDEFNEFATHQLDSADMLLFGRVTYEGMASYWPTPAAATDDRINVNPVVLGSGKPLFGGLDSTLRLNLLEAKTFKGGVVALRYKPVNGGPDGLGQN